MKHNICRRALRSFAWTGLAAFFIAAAATTAHAVSLVVTPPIPIFVTSGDPPSINTLDIGSSGAPLSFTVLTAINTPAGINWLNVPQRSGTTPATLTFTANPLGLAVNVFYSATITIIAPGATNSPLAIDISFYAAGVRQLAIDNSSLIFQSSAGSSPASQQLGITADGALGGELYYTTTVSTQSGGNWLSITPPVALTPRNMSVSANAGNLAAGVYRGAIIITDTANSAASTFVVSVLFSVGSAAPTVISLSPASLAFTAAPGTSPPPLTFQVSSSGGSSAVGWTAAASTQSGGNWLSLSPASGTTPATITATASSAQLVAGNYNGSISISSGNAANSPQVVNVSLAVARYPAVNPNGVVNGASFSQEAIVAPNSVASLFGQDMANELTSAASLPLPTNLVGTQVSVNGVAAPLFFTSPSQINFQMPPGLTGTTAQVAVIFNGLASPAIPVNIAPSVPGIFTKNQDGTGQGAVLNADFSANSAANPAARGGVIQIFATGLGPTDPPVVPGQPGNSSEPFNRTTTTPIVNIGGIPAVVQFSAIAPNFVALYQVNAVVPPGVAVGNTVPIQITIGGKSSNTATIAVR